jgi:hypothetical protein
MGIFSVSSSCSWKRIRGADWEDTLRLKMAVDARLRQDDDNPWSLVWMLTPKMIR